MRITWCAALVILLAGCGPDKRPPVGVVCNSAGLCAEVKSLDDAKGPPLWCAMPKEVCTVKTLYDQTGKWPPVK